MNQPDNERLEKIEQEIEKLKQGYAELKGQTEPIKITRLEIDSGSMHELLVQANKQLEHIVQTQTDRSEKLDALERGQQEQKQALLQEIRTISNTWLDSLQENVDEIKADITNIKATQSDHGEFLKTMATKEDIAGIREDMAVIATKQDLAVMSDRFMEMFQKLLQQKPSE